MDNNRFIRICWGDLSREARNRLINDHKIFRSLYNDNTIATIQLINNYITDGKDVLMSNGVTLDVENLKDIEPNPDNDEYIKAVKEVHMLKRVLPNRLRIYDPLDIPEGYEPMAIGGMDLIGLYNDEPYVPHNFNIISCRIINNELKVVVDSYDKAKFGATAYYAEFIILYKRKEH